MLRIGFFNKPLLLQLSCREKSQATGSWKVTTASALASLRWTPDWGTSRGTEVFFMPRPSAARLEILGRAFPLTVHFESASAAPDQLFLPAHSLNSIFIFCQRNMCTQFKESDSCIRLDKRNSILWLSSPRSNHFLLFWLGLFAVYFHISK